MRRLLGGLILVAGVGGLGWYAAQGPAVAMQDRIALAAAEVAGSAQHEVRAAVSGRDIVVSGLAEDTAEQEALLASFDAIDGRRVVASDLSILPVVTPYVANFTKAEDAVTLTGYAPSAAVRDALGLDALEIANGEPEGWGEALTSALTVAEVLKSGQVAVADQAIAVSGVVADPTARATLEAALATVPTGFTTTTDVILEDDGTPLRLILSYDGSALSGSGKIPSDLAATDLIIAGAGADLDLQEAMIPSEDGDWPTFAKAAVGALGALQSGELALENRSVVLSGVGSPDGIAAAEAALADLPDGYSVLADLALYDDGTPFRLSVTRDEVGMAASGKVPRDFVDDTGLLANADDLTTAYITDATGVWPGIAQAGLAALDALDSGTLRITGDDMTLEGEAFSTAERDAALAALDGTGVLPDITISDLGQLADFTVAFDVTRGASLSGRLPAAVTTQDISAALGVDVAGEVTQSLVAQETDFLTPLASLGDLLPEMNALTFRISEDETQVAAEAAPGVDPDRLTTALETALGDGATVASEAPDDLPAEGATRVNPLNGAAEVFTAGFWLPTFDFFATPESCTEQTEAVLAQNQIRFLSSSAELDVSSIRAINAVAALARKCAVEGGVFLQVEGHTDSSGDPESNLALSQERADAVRDALLARGLARAVVSARGFGDSQPIADNDTEEGRALNRRTAFNWNFE